MLDRVRVDADLLGQNRCLLVNERSAEAASLETGVARLEVNLLEYYARNVENRSLLARKG
jgi:hypothetical protein